MAKRYVMTPARRAALKRAQLISARKRKGKGKKLSTGQKVAIGAAGAVTVGAIAYGAHKGAGKYKAHKVSKIRSDARKRIASRPKRAPKARVTPRVRRKPGTGPPKSQSLDAVGKTFLTTMGMRDAAKRNRRKVRKGGPPKSKSRKATSARKKFASANKVARDRREAKALARHRAADKARRQRGLDGYIPGKAKHDRRRSKADRKKRPRSGIA